MLCSLRSYLSVVTVEWQPVSLKSLLKMSISKKPAMMQLEKIKFIRSKFIQGTKCHQKPFKSTDWRSLEAADRADGVVDVSVGTEDSRCADWHRIRPCLHQPGQSPSPAPGANPAEPALHRGCGSPAEGCSPLRLPFPGPPHPRGAGRGRAPPSPAACCGAGRGSRRWRWVSQPPAGWRRAPAAHHVLGVLHCVCGGGRAGRVSDQCHDFLLGLEQYQSAAEGS